MKNFVLNAMNLGGVLLVILGVFVFANSLSGRNVIIGAINLPSDTESGFGFIILGLILFGLSLIAGRFLRRKP